MEMTWQPGFFAAWHLSLLLLLQVRPPGTMTSSSVRPRSASPGAPAPAATRTGTPAPADALAPLPELAAAAGGSVAAPVPAPAAALDGSAVGAAPPPVLPPAHPSQERAARHRACQLLESLSAASFTPSRCLVTRPLSAVSALARHARTRAVRSDTNDMI